MVRFLAMGAHLAAIATMLVMLYVFLTRLKSKKREFLVLFTFSSLVFALGGFFEILATSSEAAWFGIVLSGAGMLVAPMFLFFVQQYANIYLPKSINTAILASAGVIMLLIWTTLWHGLMMERPYVVPDSALYFDIYHWGVARGPLFLLIVVHPFLVNVATIFIFVKKIHMSDVGQKRRLAILLAAIILPSLVHSISFLIPFTPDMHVVVLLIAPANVLIYFAIYKHDLLENEKVEETNEINEILLGALPFVITIWNRHYQIIATSQQAAKVFDLSPQQDFAAHFYDFCPEYQPCGTPSRQKYEAFLNKAIEEGHCHFEWMHQDTHRTPIPTEVTLIRFARKGEYFVVGYMVDLRHSKERITQEYEIRNTFREAEIKERIQVMFDATPLCVEYWDPDFSLRDCNKVTLNFYNLPNIDAYRAQLSAVGESQKQQNIKDEWNHHLAEIFETGSTSFEYAEQRPDGSYIFMEVYGIRLKINHEHIAITYAKDVTQLKKSEDTVFRALETLKHRENILNTVNKAASEMLTVSSFAEYNTALHNSLEMIGHCVKADRVNLIRAEVEPDGLTLTLTNQWASALGSSVAQMSLGGKMPIGTLPVCEAMFFSGESFNGPIRELPAEEVALLDPSGKIISLFIIPIFNNHTLWGFFSIDDCVNERRLSNEEMDILQSASLMVFSTYHRLNQEAEMHRVEIAEESNRTKTKFLARMSHELRTPITAVLGVSEIHLQSQDLTPETENAFARINMSANTLLGIVNDILDLSKIEADKLEIIQEPYDLPHMINNITQTHILSIGHRNIEFHLHVDPNLPLHLIGDALRIEQILNNLLSNAFKYTEAGYVELVVAGCPGEKGYTNLAISIRDTGFGMSKEQIAILLSSEYERFHEYENRFIAGTGLGMPVVFNLLKLMDATMNIDSELGKGTTVHLFIPQKQHTSEGIPKQTIARLEKFENIQLSAEREDTFEVAQMPEGRVLVVDDIETNLYVAKGLLSFYGLHIETCESGYEAIEKIRQGNIYHIIFMDFMMPGLDGSQTMLALREMGYTNPIIALTANNIMGQAEAFLAKGFDDFIPKPIDTTLLNTILTKYVESIQLPDPHAASQYKEGVLEKLRNDFALGQKNALANIKQALEAGDISRATIIAHSIKGLAGLIYEEALAQAAAMVENTLKAERTLSPKALEALEHEFNCVLNSIGTTPAPHAPQNVDTAKAQAIFNELHPLLKAQNTKAITFVDDLKNIPETVALVKLIDEFEFEMALKVLEILMDR